MISFACDYIAGAHPAVLKRMEESNLEIHPGYGSDAYCESASKKILEACKADNGEVYFFIGGTQVNLVAISSMLAPFEGVIAAKSGHVSVHEAGAIEYTGHKVLEIEGEDGKLNAAQIKKYIEDFWNDGNHDHMVHPGLVYISQPTEYGTLYSKDELKAIYDVCREKDILLYIDGARLAYALASPANDVSLKDLASLCDAFYIGGTKCGLLFGEALVFPHANAPKCFFTQMKQHGAVLAKGRLLGVQFDALFTDGLYEKIGEHAISRAQILKKMLIDKGLKMYIDSPTNQQFVIVSDDTLEKLKDKVEYEFWEKYDDTHAVVRFCTSWSTTDEELDELKKILEEI